MKNTFITILGIIAGWSLLFTVVASMSFNPILVIYNIKPIKIEPSELPKDGKLPLRRWVIMNTELDPNDSKRNFVKISKTSTYGENSEKCELRISLRVMNANTPVYISQTLPKECVLSDKEAEAIENDNTGVLKGSVTIQGVLKRADDDSELNGAYIIVSDAKPSLFSLYCLIVFVLSGFGTLILYLRSKSNHLISSDIKLLNDGVPVSIGDVVPFKIYFQSKADIYLDLLELEIITSTKATKFMSMRRSYETMLRKIVLMKDVELKNQEKHENSYEFMIPDDGGKIVTCAVKFRWKIKNKLPIEKIVKLNLK